MKESIDMKKIEAILRETEEQFNEASMHLEIESREQAIAGALLNAKRDLNTLLRDRDEALRAFVKGDDEALGVWVEIREDIAATEKLIGHLQDVQKLLSAEVQN